MKMLFFLSIILLSWTKHTYAQNIFVCKNVTISFYSSAPIEDIEAITDKAVSALNIANNTVYFKVPIRSFRFQKSLMQEHFNENFLESDRYPYSTFNGTLVNAVDFNKEGKYPVVVEGQLSIHGVTRKYREKGALEVNNGRITIASEFKVRLADHHVAIPKLLFKNIAEVVSVKVHATYLPEK